MFKAGDVVEWVSHNPEWDLPSVSGFHHLKGKPLSVALVFPATQTAQLTEMGSTTIVAQVHMSGLVKWGEKKMVVSSVITPAFLRELHQFYPELYSVVKEYQPKFKTKEILEKEFMDFKQTLHPFMTKLKKLDDEQSDYVLEKLKTILLTLSKRVVKEENLVPVKPAAATGSALQKPTRIPYGYVDFSVAG
jgi:hypothetical protein